MFGAAGIKSRMDDHATLLTRIAEALERLAPVPAPLLDPEVGDAFVWSSERLHLVTGAAAQPLERFAGVDAQRDTLLENLRRHARGLPAHDVLLWGARGMGKSSLVRSIAAVLRSGGDDLALVQVARDDIASLGALFETLGRSARRFVIFADDLSFEADETQYKALRSVLDGGITARPANVRIAVTSNRRHLVPRDHAENDAVNPRDVLDDRLALDDRFGLSLGFHNCDQPTYLAMVRGYANALGLQVEDGAALAWATGRGHRSGRVAWQFIEEVAGAAGRMIG